jgi:hypothetical protein
MNQHDDEIERYLKEFRPQAIRELELGPQLRSIFWRRLAAAAAVTVCAGGLLWFGRHELMGTKEAMNVQLGKVDLAYRRQYPTTLALTKLALANNERFEMLLAEESRKSLPRFQGEQSGLSVLAKD